MSLVSLSTEIPPAAKIARIHHVDELVNKIGTSPSHSSQKRIKAARKKLNQVIKEQRRYAKSGKLRAIAVTLTYRDAKHFSPKHISAFLDQLRRKSKRMGHLLPYAWVLEYASRLHYHLILWLPRGYSLDPVKLSKWWPWGSTWIEGCRCIKAWARYISKFDTTIKLPKGGRLYGYGGLDDPGKMAVSRATLPRWLLALLSANHSARRCPGGGWVNRATGEIYRSPYVWTPRGVVLANVSLPICH